MGGGTGRRIALTGAALLVLLAVVGLASRAHTAVGGGPVRSVSSDILVEYLLLLTVAAAVIVVPVAIWAFVSGRGEEDMKLPARKNWMVAVLVFMTGLSVVSLLLLSVLKHHRGRDAVKPLAPLLALAGRGARTPQAVRFDWMPVIVVSALTAVGVAAAGVIIVRRREPAAKRGVAEALALTLDESLDDLRGDLDPRSAVIFAYAHMEHVLAQFGLEREPSEAPREYLRRVLPGIGAGADSVERLTALYEHARFSPHEVDGGMKDEAIAALETLRDELRSAG